MTNHRALMHEDDVVLFFSTREQAYAAVSAAYQHAKSLVENALASDPDAPWRGRIVIGQDRDDMTTKQRRFLHGPVFGQIAEQAVVDGRRFVREVWKEFFRKQFLGDRWESVRFPGQKRATPRRVRISTEDLSVKQYSEHIDRVLAYAATELGVVFDLDAGEREAARYKAPLRKARQQAREEATA